MDYKHVTSIATQRCDSLKAGLQDGEGYYIDPTYNQGDGLCRSIPAASVQHVRRAHTHGGAYWLDSGDHASAQTYLPLQISGILTNLTGEFPVPPRNDLSCAHTLRLDCHPYLPIWIHS